MKHLGILFLTGAGLTCTACTEKVVYHHRTHHYYESAPRGDTGDRAPEAETQVTVPGGAVHLQDSGSAGSFRAESER